MADGELVLYHALGSTASKKVRLTLYEKGIDFGSVVLNLKTFDHHAPDYVALNPNGVVPTLVHRGRPLVESSVIMDYLDEIFPEPPLKPEDPFLRAQMRIWVKLSDDVAAGAVAAPSWMISNIDAFAGKNAEERDAILARVPTRERRERWQAMAAGGFKPQEIERAEERMHICLGRMEVALGDRDWLVGSYSLADIALVPFIDRMRSIRPQFFEGDRYCRVGDWFARLSARPAFAPAFNFRPAAPAAGVA